MTDADDADTAVVLDMLRGIAGESNDPDVLLAQRLIGLTDGSTDQVDSALKDLLRDAHTD